MTAWIRTTALVAGLVVGVAACGGGGEQPPGEPGGKPLAGQTVEVAAKWTGTEQANFEKVLDAFETKTGATVTYSSTGEDTGAYLGPRIQAGKPPDVAILPQPGLVEQYAKQNALKPLSDDAANAVNQHYSSYWKELGSYQGKLYGVLVKAAHKSTMWYRDKAFTDAGVQPPQTYEDLVTKTAPTLADAGTVPFSMCGASGWTLTDWFENVYLSQAGPDMYDKLAKHEIPWTDASVTRALETLARIWGKSDWLVGGTRGALQTDFPGCVNTVFAQNKGAMVFEGDFVAVPIAETDAKVGVDAKIFPFPKVGEVAPVVVGGDIAVALKDSKGAMELLKFLASPEAGETWAKLGGYLSPNKNVPATVYPDEVTKQLAQTILAAADQVRYDMSDLAPSEFGGTEGKGQWKHLQDFLRNPSQVRETQAKLEADAKKAWKS